MKEFTKNNTNLRTKLATFCEQVDKAKVDAMEEFKDSLPYFDKLGG